MKIIFQCVDYSNTLKQMSLSVYMINVCYPLQFIINYNTQIFYSCVYCQLNSAMQNVIGQDNYGSSFHTLLDLYSLK